MTGEKASRTLETGLLAAFEAGTIDPAEFDHRAHLRVAWTYLERLPVLDTVSRMAAGLKGLTASAGVPEKYHETITAFFVLLVAERRDGRARQTFDAFCRENPDLLAGTRRLLLRHYSRERLDSNLAR